MCGWRSFCAKVARGSEKVLTKCKPCKDSRYFSILEMLTFEALDARLRSLDPQKWNLRSILHHTCCTQTFPRSLMRPTQVMLDYVHVPPRHPWRCEMAKSRGVRHHSTPSSNPSLTMHMCVGLGKRGLVQIWGFNCNHVVCSSRIWARFGPCTHFKRSRLAFTVEFEPNLSPGIRIAKWRSKQCVGGDHFAQKSHGAPRKS